MNEQKKQDDHLERFMQRKGLKPSGSGVETFGDYTIKRYENRYVVHRKDEPWRILLAVTNRLDYATFEKLVELTAK